MVRRRALVPYLGTSTAHPTVNLYAKRRSRPILTEARVSAQCCLPSQTPDTLVVTRAVYMAMLQHVFPDRGTRRPKVLPCMTYLQR